MDHLAMKCCLDREEATLLMVAKEMILLAVALHQRLISGMIFSAAAKVMTRFMGMEEMT